MYFFSNLLANFQKNFMQLHANIVFVQISCYRVCWSSGRKRAAQILNCTIWWAAIPLCNRMRASVLYVWVV